MDGRDRRGPAGDPRVRVQFIERAVVFDNAYGSIIWALLLLHTTHVATDWGDTVVLAALMRTPTARPPRRLVDTDENSLYWRFVWLSWLPIYAADLLGSEAVPMRRSGEFLDLMIPWTGLVTAFVALAVAHQFGSDGMFDNCLAVSPVPLIAVSLLAIAAAVVGGLVVVAGVAQ